MIDASRKPNEILYAEARDKARRAAAELVKDTGLCIREQTYELVITNPRNPDSGQIHLDYADGYVSWSRVVWDYWGQLESLGDGTETAVGAEKIIETLMQDEM